MEPPWEVGKKVYINGTGHMTKMATMLIYGKYLQKSNMPRYQVSVYRTIGPLVIITIIITIIIIIIIIIIMAKHVH